jgi:hypothetical protein
MESRFQLDSGPLSLVSCREKVAFDAAFHFTQTQRSGNLIDKNIPRSYGGLRKVLLEECHPIFIVAITDTCRVFPTSADKAPKGRKERPED